MENCEAMTSSTHSFAYSYWLVKKCFLKICETSKCHNFLIFQPIFIRFSLFCSKLFTLSSEIKLNLFWISSLRLLTSEPRQLCLVHYLNFYKGIIIVRNYMYLSNSKTTVTMLGAIKSHSSKTDGTCNVGFQIDPVQPLPTVGKLTWWWYHGNSVTHFAFFTGIVLLSSPPQTLPIPTLVSLNIVSWEPEGRYYYLKMLRWEPEGRSHHRLCSAIEPFWFSTELLWIFTAPFWLSTDDMWSLVK